MTVFSLQQTEMQCNLHVAGLSSRPDAQSGLPSQINESCMQEVFAPHEKRPRPHVMLAVTVTNIVKSNK